MGRIAKVNRWIEIVQRLIYPARCLWCGDVGDGVDLCAGCRAELPWVEHACSRCGLPLEPAADGALCGRCLRRPPAYDRLVAPLRYAEPVDRLVQGFKFNGRLAAGRLLATLLAEQLARPSSVPSPELLVPVPLHHERLRERGFNQAGEIARVIGRRLRLPVAAGRCARLQPTPPQSRLDLAGRRRNLRGVFACRPLDGLRVALVDDVVTSATTVENLALAARAAGAVGVEVWAVARALPPSR